MPKLLLQTLNNTAGGHGSESLRVDTEILICYSKAFGRAADVLRSTERCVKGPTERWEDPDVDVGTHIDQEPVTTDDNSYTKTYYSKDGNLSDTHTYLETNTYIYICGGYV